MPTTHTLFNSASLPEMLAKYTKLHGIGLSLDAALWVWEPESDALYFNARYMQMLGYEQHAFPFHISTWQSLIHPEDREKIVSEQEDLILHQDLGDSFECIFRLRAATGEYLWILGRGFVICRNEQGKAVRIAGLHFDMRVLDKMLEDANLQQDRMWFALDATRDGVWDWNAQTDEVYFSPRYISMLGYTPTQFPPTLESWTRCIHPEDRASTAERQMQHVTNPAMGDLFECVYRLLASDGTYKWVLGRGRVTQRDENGRGLRVVGVHTDITSLCSARENLTNMLHQDSLTRLCSRFYFDSVVRQLSSNDFPLSVLYCDLDGLKMINDNLGHSVGDDLLIAAASIVRRCLPMGNVAARLGGDEFVVLLRQTKPEEALFICKAIQLECASNNAQESLLPVYLSVGMACTDGGMSVDTLLDLADRKMRQYKKEQRQTSCTQIKKYIEKKLKKPAIVNENRI